MNETHGTWRIEIVDELTRPQKLAIMRIWNNEFPDHLGYGSLDAFDQYLATLANPEHILVVNQHKGVGGWAAMFDRLGARWFLVLLDADVQGRKLGSKIMIYMKQSEPELNGWVVDHDRDKKIGGQSYLSPLGFYLRLGFKVIRKDRLEKDALSTVRIQWKR